MGADLDQLVAFGVPFDLMVYLSALPLASLEVVHVERPYAVLRGRRLPRRGHPAGIYDGWGPRGHELVLDLGPDSRAEPAYYGEGTRDLAVILHHVLTRPAYAAWRTRIHRAMGKHPTTGAGADYWTMLERLGFDRLRHGLYVYRQAREKVRAR